MTPPAPTPAAPSGPPSTGLSGRGVLLTGGTGRLGRELVTLLPGITAPSHAELDVTDPGGVSAAVERIGPRVIVHAAAYTDVAGAERERAACWRVNVEGTRNVARAARAAGAKLVLISTDYVFDGQRGQYREEDTPGPVVNYYALTKLVAEEAARAAPEHLILRTSFRPRQWPYDTAFTDVFTSQDYVDIIAPEIALAITHSAKIAFDVLHVAGDRKSVYELARRRKPDVTPASKATAGVGLPDDVSLDTSRWRALREQLLGAARGDS